MNRNNPLILVHGLWNTPYLFDTICNILSNNNISVYCPSLPHKCGRISLPDLAVDLEIYIKSTFDSSTNIDVLGFSMGGLILRYWLQKLGGSLQTNRFFSIGTPHFGTFTADLVPFSWLEGIADMKTNSSFLRYLNEDVSLLKNVQCYSYGCSSDLMVIPYSNSFLPFGAARKIPVLTHRSLITSRKSISILLEDILVK